MDIGTIVGWLLGGFATRIYAAAAAGWVALEAAGPLATTAKAFTAATSALG